MISKTRGKNRENETDMFFFSERHCCRGLRLKNALLFDDFDVYIW